MLTSAPARQLYGNDKLTLPVLGSNCTSSNLNIPVDVAVNILLKIALKTDCVIYIYAFDILSHSQCLNLRDEFCRLLSSNCSIWASTEKCYYANSGAQYYSPKEQVHILSQYIFFKLYEV